MSNSIHQDKRHLDKRTCCISVEEAGKRCIQQGFAYPVEVFSPTEANELYKKLQQYEASLCPNTNQKKLLSGDDRFKIHLLLPWAWEIVYHPVLVDLACTCLGTDDVWCWSTDLNIKEPKSDTIYTWHQDSTYSGIDPPNAAITVWLALTPSTVESGCVRCIPNSHLHGQYPHVEGQGGKGNVLAMKQEIQSFSSSVNENLVGPDQAEAMVLRPGQASVHSFLTIHSSDPNTTTNSRRIGLAIRYVSAQCTKKKQQQQGTSTAANVNVKVLKETATLVSGNGCNLFDEEPKPVTACGEKERLAHSAALQREKHNYLPEGHCYK